MARDRTDHDILGPLRSFAFEFLKGGFETGIDRRTWTLDVSDDNGRATTLTLLEAAGGPEAIACLVHDYEAAGASVEPSAETRRL